MGGMIPHTWSWRLSYPVLEQSHRMSSDLPRNVAIFLISNLFNQETHLQSVYSFNYMGMIYDIPYNLQPFRKILDEYN